MNVEIYVVKYPNGRYLNLDKGGPRKDFGHIMDAYLYTNRGVAGLDARNIKGRVFAVTLTVAEEPLP